MLNSLLTRMGVLRSRLARDPNLRRKLGLGPLAENVRMFSA